MASEKDFYIKYLDRKEDSRGLLFEILRFKDDTIPGEGYMYTLSINKGQRRGDHYHTKKLEWFSCVSGEAIILLETKNGHKEKIILNTKKPAVIFCGPYTAHTLLNYNDEAAVIVSYGSRQHDPDDPDTFPKIVDIR